MRQLLRVGLLLMLLIAAAAQRRGFAPMPRPMPPIGISPPITTPPTPSLGAWRNAGGPPHTSPQQPSVVVMPYAAPFPVYVEPEAPFTDPQATATEDGVPQGMPYPAPAPNAPALMPRPPMLQPATEASAAGLAPCGRTPDPAPASLAMRTTPPDDPPSFYIAMKDGWVYVARAYWVDKDTLHYITANGRHDQVSLVLVNRQVSIRLNAKRADEFRLPE